MAMYSNRINVIATSRSMPNLRLMITNTQNVSTPAGLQVLATVPLTFGKYSVDFDKIAFYYNGNPVYSWVESVSNGNMNVWLKMPVSIPANTSITINAMPNIETVFDNNYWGCAPTLTNQYGQYDNGANVFNYYQNFSGTALWNGLSTISNVTLTQNNGLTIGVNIWGNTFYILTDINLTSPFIYQVLYTDYGSSGNPQFGLVIDSNTNISQNTGGSPGGTNYMYRLGTSCGYALINGNTVLNSTSVSFSYPYTTIGTFIQNSTGITSIVNNYTLKASTTTLSSGYIGFYIYSGIATKQQVFVQWLRVRAYPPNGVLPSVTVSY